MTVPTGVLAYVRSCWVQCSEPGATPGQIFTVCAWRHVVADIARAAAATASIGILVRRIMARSTRLGIRMRNRQRVEPACDSHGHQLAQAAVGRELRISRLIAPDGSTTRRARPLAEYHPD